MEGVGGVWENRGGEEGRIRESGGDLHPERAAWIELFAEKFAHPRREAPGQGEEADCQ